MTNKAHFGFIVEYVKDIEASKRFYVEVLGLQMQRYHPTFVQFEHFAIAGDQPAGTSGEPEVYWLVDDVAAAYRDLSPKSEVVVPLTEKPFGTYFAVTDPDGRPRYLLELAQNRPSQAV